MRIDPADGIAPLAIPLPAGRELRLTPSEGLRGRVLVELAVAERGAALFQPTTEPILLPAPMLRPLAVAVLKMVRRLEKAAERAAEHDVWRPA